MLKFFYFCRKECFPCLLGIRFSRQLTGAFRYVSGKSYFKTLLRSVRHLNFSKQRLYYSLTSCTGLPENSDGSIKSAAEFKKL